MKTSEKLLRRLKQDFPEIAIEDSARLVRVSGISDGCGFKWSSMGVNKTHYFSYESVSNLLKAKEIGAWWSSGLGGSPRGWEFYSVDWSGDEN